MSAEFANFWSSSWRLLPPLLLAALAVYLLLPQPRRKAAAAGALCGIVALTLGALALFRIEGAFSVESFLFLAFSAVAIGGGLLLITQRNPARAAIAFALVVMNVCGLFLLQAAPFLMAASIIIYAGAIIVTFLFVLMLAQQTGFSDADDRTREPLTASFAAFVMLGAILVLLDHTFPDPREFQHLLDRLAKAAQKQSAADIRDALGDREQLLSALRAESERLRGSANADRWSAAADDLKAELESDRATAASLRQDLEGLLAAGRQIRDENRAARLPAENVAAVGRLLFSDYLLAVEMGGTLLLVATAGAIAITHRSSERAA